MVFFKLILLAAGHWTKSVLVLLYPKGNFFIRLCYRTEGEKLANVFIPPYTHLAAFLQASRSRMTPALTAVVAVTVTSISPMYT